MGLWKCFFILYSILYICAVTAQNIAEIIKQRENDELLQKAEFINDIKEKVEKLSSGLAKLSGNDQAQALQKIKSRLRASVQTKDARDVINIVIDGIKTQLKKNKTSEDFNKNMDYRMEERLAAKMVGKDDDVTNEIKHEEKDDVNLFGPEYVDKTTAFSKKKIIPAHLKNVKFEWLKVEEIENRKPKTKTVNKSIPIDGQQASSSNNNKDEKDTNGDKDAGPIKSSVINGTTKQMNARKTLKVIPKDKKVSKNCGCRCQTEMICTKLKKMGTLQCDSKEAEVPLKKLCDGAYDCSDNSDELQCSRKAAKKIRFAKKVLTQAMTMPTGCLESYVQNMLLNQYKFLRQTENLTFIIRDDFEGVIKDRILLEQTANQVAIVVTTVATAMDGGLCMDQFIDHSIERTVFKDDNGLDDDLELDDEREISDKWTTKACSCDGAQCLNFPCSDECQMVCTHTYNLQRFKCQPIIVTTGSQSSVSLNMLCDGKMDCSGATDENDCVEGNSYGKFQANLLYNDILEMITKKMTSNDYKSVKSSLSHLYSWVAHLQKISTEAKVNMTATKAARDGTFQALSALYIRKIEEIGIVEKVEDVYDFLNAINELLVTALFNSHTGNERLIAYSKCFCQNEECTVPECSRTCARACAVEKRFTMAICENNPTANITIPVEAVCDGKKDCVYGEDEAACKIGLCQKHHFKSLAMQVDTMGSKNKGNVLGEIIRVWQTKVISNLNKIAKSERPSRKQLNYAVKDAMNDLVKVYASIDETSKIMMQGTRVFDALEDIARETMDVLRQCTM